MVVLSDNYAYFRNINGDAKTHSAYVVMGSTLMFLMSEPVPRPLDIPEYTTAWIVADTTGTGKLVVAHQFTKDFIRLTSDPRKSAAEIINPNAQSPNEMDFTYPSTSQLRRPTFPEFGRWVYTSSSGSILNYIEYDPNINGTRKKTFTKTLTAGMNRIVSVSSNFDCVLTYIYATAFDAVLINSTASTAAIIPAWTIVNADSSDASLSTLYTIQEIKAGPGCWALKVGSFFYTKNADGSAFVKNTRASSFTGAFYDNSLKYAYSSGQVYKWGTSGFELLFSASGMKSTV